jgi:tetratricopeptide (TPR) repeat protein
LRRGGKGPKISPDWLVIMKEESQEKKEKEVGAHEVALAAGLKSSVFIQLAEAYRSQGRYEEAILTCQKGLEKMPDSLPGRLLLGRCYLEKSMIPQAKEELEKVAREMEACFGVYQLLSLVYLQEKNVEKSLEVLKKSLNLPSPEEKPKKGIPPREMDLLRRGPSPPEVTPGMDLPKTSREMEKTVEAEKAAPTAFQTDTLAEIYIKQGRVDRALSVYQEILAREPENALVREKVDALKKRVEGDQKVASQKKMLSHLEQWLAAVSRKDDSTPT